MNYNELDFRGLSADQQLTMSEAFPILMRKVYGWMTLALVITGLTAYGVATSPGILQAIYGNQWIMWGLIIAELALVIGVSAAINRISLTTATLMFILYFCHQWCVALLNFLGLYGSFYCNGVLYYCRNVWCDGTYWLHNEN